MQCNICVIARPDPQRPQRPQRPKINTAGLNADTVDGKHAADFVQKTGDQAMSGALTAANFRYGAPQTSYVSIAPAAFSPYDSATTYSFESTGALIWSGGGLGIFRAPVNLPNGATITSFRVQGWDNVPYPPNWMVYLLRRWSIGAADENLTGLDSQGTNLPEWFDRESTTIILPYVENNKYNYFVEVQFPAGTPDLKFGGASIGYTVPTP